MTGNLVTVTMVTDGPPLCVGAH